MGVIDKIKGLFRRDSLTTVIKTVYGNDIYMFARSYAANIYQIPEVRTAIECFADIFSSIPKYIERVDTDGNITYYERTATAQTLTLRANPLQNATQFWKEVITRLMLDNNVFILPAYDKGTGELIELIVLPYSNYEFDFDGGQAVVKLMLTTGANKTYRLNDLIYLNRFSNITGGARNNLGLYETVVQSLAQQAINVASPNKVKAFLQGKMGAASPALKDRNKSGTMADLKANMDSNVQGIAYLDGQWAVTPINWTENDVNRGLMQFVVNIVYNYFGITTEIINNKATEIEYQMFVRNRIEPLARQTEQEFTSKIFTPREISFGNKLELDTFSLYVSTLSAKTAFFNVGLRQGVLTIDEAREMVGQPPLPDGLGRMVRVTADTMDINLVNEMQAAQKGANINKENENGTEGNGKDGQADTIQAS